MMNVDCDGSEENLDLCSFDWAPEGACNHSMDAVVECYGGAPTAGNASTTEQCTISTLQELLTLARSNLNLARGELNAVREEINNERNTMRGLITQARSTLDMSKQELISERQTRILEHNATIRTMSSVRKAITQHTTQLSGLHRNVTLLERNSNVLGNRYSSKYTLYTIISNVSLDVLKNHQNEQDISKRNITKLFYSVSDSFSVAFQATLGSYYPHSTVRFNDVNINLGNG